MNTTIAMQLQSLIIFTISGVAIGIFFDIFRILRKSFKTPDIITYLEDIIFWIITGIFFLFVLFKFNNGQIRSYVIIGTITGAALYLILLSKHFIKFSVSAIIFLKKIIAYPIKILLKILKKIFKPLSFVVINIRKSIKNLVKKIIKKERNVNKIKKTHTERRIMEKNVE